MVNTLFQSKDVKSCMNNLFDYFNDSKMHFSNSSEFIMKTSGVKETITSIYKTLKRNFVFPFTYFIFDYNLNRIFKHYYKNGERSIIPIVNTLKDNLSSITPMMKNYNEFTFYIHSFKKFYLYNISSTIFFFDKTKFLFSKKILNFFIRKITAMENREFLIQYSILKRICDEMNIFLTHSRLNKKNDSEKLKISLHVFYLTYVVYQRYLLYEQNTEKFLGYSKTNLSDEVSIDANLISRTKRFPSLLVVDENPQEEKFKKEMDPIIDKFSHHMIKIAENMGKRTFKYGILKDIFMKEHIEEVYDEAIMDLPILFDQIIDYCEYFSLKIATVFTDFSKEIIKRLDTLQLERNLKLQFIRGMLFYLKDFLRKGLNQNEIASNKKENIEDNFIPLIDHFFVLESNLIKLGFTATEINLLQYLNPIFEEWLNKFYKETKKMIDLIRINNFSDEENTNPKLPLASSIDFINILNEYSIVFSLLFKQKNTYDSFIIRLKDKIVFLLQYFIKQEFKIVYDGEMFLPSYVFQKGDIKKFVEKIFTKEQIGNSQKMSKKAIVYINNLYFIETKLKEHSFYSKLFFEENRSKYLSDSKKRFLNILVQDTFHHLLRSIVIQIFTKNMTDDTLNESRIENMNFSQRDVISKVEKIRGAKNKVTLLMKNTPIFN